MFILCKHLLKSEQGSFITYSFVKLLKNPLIHAHGLHEFIKSEGVGVF